ncbi:MAG: peptidoglycan-binding domain-containing protein [Patescibacteria group bacterium]
MKKQFLSGVIATVLLFGLLCSRAEASDDLVFRISNLQSQIASLTVGLNALLAQQASTTPSLIVVSPNGGESYRIGDVVNIKWTASNLSTSSSVYIELRSSAGVSPVATKIAVVPAIGLYYSWKIPSTVTAGSYIIEIYKANKYGNIDSNSSVKDISDASFTITSSTGTLQGYYFTKNLGLGSEGADVRMLQKFLVSKGFLSSSDVSGYFGNRTKTALAGYQASVGIAPADGYFGPITRARVNAELATSPIVASLVITSPIGDMWMASSSNKITWTASQNIATVRLASYLLGTSKNGYFAQGIPASQGYYNFTTGPSPLLGSFILEIEGLDVNNNVIATAKTTFSIIASNSPIIKSISSTSGISGQAITITGSGFINGNNNGYGSSEVDFLKGGVWVGTIAPVATDPLAISLDGTVLKFTLDPVFVANIGSGTYQLQVSNPITGGKSNTVQFTVLPFYGTY